VVDAGAITAVDYTAARALLALVEDLARDGVTLLLVHVDPFLRSDLDRHRVTPSIGPERIFDKLHTALAAIESPRLCV